MDNPFQTPLPFKEAIISYSISGNQKGTQTTYIKEYGKKRAIYRHSHAKIMHTNKYDDTLIMIDENWTYTINLKTKEAIKEPSLNKLLINEFNKLTKKEQDFIKKKKTKRILDFDCQTISIDGVLRYVTKKGNLLMRSRASIMGYNTQTIASSINIVDLNDTPFTLPKDLKIREKKADTAKAKKIIEALLKKEHEKREKYALDYQSIIQEGIDALKGTSNKSTLE